MNGHNRVRSVPYMALSAALFGCALFFAITLWRGESMARGGIHSVYDAKCVYNDDAPRPALALAGKISLPLSLTRDGLQVLRVRGANMAPLISEGAHVGVDTMDTDVVSGRIYAIFAPNEGVVLRRVFLNSTQDGYVLRSEAASFPETQLAAGLLAKRMINRFETERPSLPAIALNTDNVVLTAIANDRLHED